MSPDGTATHSTEPDDRTAIHAQVLAYCRAVDRRDWSGIRAVYADDGVDHHTGFDGGADDYVAWLRRSLPFLDGTMHMLANHTCHVRGDQAVSETYGQAVHWGTPSDSAALNFTSGFRYVDHWVRTGAGWRIRERFAVREWQRDDSTRITGRAVHPPVGAADDVGPAEQDPFDVLVARVTGGR